MGLHRGCILSPFLFALVMDELSGRLREVPWCMCGDKRWSKGLRLSRTKARIFEVQFGDVVEEAEGGSETCHRDHLREKVLSILECSNPRKW
ncbi:hypothetical protein H5410_001396 [Solanum commersonii]|uniref:Uncharacterized protein n=1 Tax=Solanum commersonii TaxID=4109 RepID=A0A9J6B009_SOLCO|nr:hypothetical protein H5410_001396 [Solanum commersonii]